MTNRAEVTLTYAILVAFTIVALFPVFGVLSLAFQPPGAAGGFALPETVTLENFSRAWRVGAGFSSYLTSSIIVTSSTVAIATVLSILAGYAFGTMRFRGATVIFYVFLLGIIVPYEAILIALFYDLRAIGLTDTYWALILPESALSIAFGTFWMRAFFLAAPRSLIDAARIDGASSWSVLWRVLVPYGRPAVLTMMVLIFMWTWNSFLLTLVMVQNEDLRTAPLGLAFFVGRFQTDFSGLAAGAVLVALPIVFVYLILQRHFIRGMMAGALKG